MAQLASLSVNDTGSLTLPSGTSANRPSLSSTVIVQWTNTGTQAVSVTSGSATTTTTSWTCPTGVTSIEVLVVAGGGGGGSGSGGGGGAGGVIYNSAFPVTPTTTYTITVGGGGAGTGNNSARGSNGSNSIFGALTALGGGGGASISAQGGVTGGSGGGDSHTGQVPGSGTAGQGNPGGKATLAAYDEAGGGGGGAGETPAPAFGIQITSQTLAGLGGTGLAFNTSGVSAYYAGGGAGGVMRGSLPQRGGLGGGGNGAGNGTNATNGTASTGGGGGGGGRSDLSPAASNTGGTGGSGIVIIRYALATATTQPTGQTRFNTVTNTFENYETSNRWKTAPIGDNIVTNGLVAYLDGARYSSGTTWVDMSGLGNDVALTNGPTYTSANGGAIVFDGTNDYAVSGTFTQHQTTTITLSAWVYPTVISGNSYVIGVGGGTNGTARAIRVNGGQFGAPGYGNNGTHDFNTTGAYAVANAWQHVCCVWNGTTATFYLNGNITATTTLSGLITPTGSAYYISSEPWSNPGSVWNGKIACASIHTRALTPDEVKQNYNAQSYRFELASPVESRQSYVTDRLVVDLDISNPSCFNLDTDKLVDLASGSIGTLGQGAAPIVTPNYKYVRLDGTNDYISMTNPNVYLGNQHSYDFWIYVTGIKDATYARAYIIDLRGDGADSGCNSYFLWDYVSAGVVNFITGNSNIEVNINGIALSSNAWHHMATTRDGAQWRVYLDGVLLTQGASNLTALTLNNAYRIGMYSGWNFSNANYALPGYIGAARIYAKTLTSSEVMINYQAMKNRFGL